METHKRYVFAGLALGTAVLFCVPILLELHAELPATVTQSQQAVPVKVESADTRSRHVAEVRPAFAAAAVEAPEDDVASVAEEEPVPDPKPEPEPVEVVVEPVVVPEPEPVVPPVSFTEALIEYIAIYTNRERGSEGLPSLSFDTALARIADGHSTDMGVRDYLAHESPEGCDNTCRFKAAGYKAQVWGENIIWIEATTIPPARELARTFVDEWMNQPGHRANILSADYTRQGIGVYRDDDEVYVAVTFAKP